MKTALHSTLLAIATELAEQRFPNEDAYVAAMQTSTGRILTSVYAEAAVDSACLCAETGAICEAHKLNEAVVASLCLFRCASSGERHILPACGICQERLAYWGLEVLVAVPAPPNEAGELAMLKTLRDLRPYYWNGDA